MARKPATKSKGGTPAVPKRLIGATAALSHSCGEAASNLKVLHEHRANLFRVTVNIGKQTLPAMDKADLSIGDANSRMSDEYMTLLASNIDAVRKGSKSVAGYVLHGDADSMDALMNPGGKAWSVSLNAALLKALNATQLAEVTCESRSFLTNPEAEATLLECAAFFKRCVEEMRGLRSVSPTPATKVDAAVTMKRPIPVAEAARALNVRSDVLLNKLRVRGARVGGVKGSYKAEYEDLRASIDSRKNKLFKTWADKIYPAEE